MTLVPDSRAVRPQRIRGVRRGTAAAAAVAVVSALCTVLPATAAHAAPAEQLIYIANMSSNSVAAYDPVSKTVVATIPVGSSPQFVALSPDNAQVYVTNTGSNSVSVIDTATNTVTATIAVGNAPVPMAVSPDGAHVYVGDSGGAVDVIDTAARKVSTKIATGGLVTAVGLSPDGSRAYATDFFHDTVSVIDTTTNTVSATIKEPPGSSPMAMVVSPDGSKAYVTNHNGNSVTVIDTATRAIVATVLVGKQPDSVAVTPDGQHVYVANRTAGSVSILDASTLKVVATVPVGPGPSGVAVDPAGGTVYVTNNFGNTMSVIDAATNTVTATVPAGSRPLGLAVTKAVPPPTVTGIAPGHGPVAGGTTVTLTGSNLTGTSAVTFDGTPASDVTVVNATTVTVTAPPHAAGTVAVTLTASGRTVDAGQYTYDVPAPVVTGIAPDHGPLAGGTTVTITGSHLTGATAVKFGTTPATAFTVDSDTQITATVPAGSAAGAVDVTVTTPAGTSAAGQYTYDAAVVGSYVFSETPDPKSGSTVKTGDKVTYTVTVAQQGAGEVKGATITGDLSKVLDAATYNDDVKATSGTAEVKDGKLTWTGDLPVGGNATVTYSVTVNGNGSGRLHNVVTTSDDKRGHCDTAKSCESDLTVSTASTPTPTPTPIGDGDQTPSPAPSPLGAVTPDDSSAPQASGILASTGATVVGPAAIAGALLILGGIAVARSRRRHG